MADNRENDDRLDASIDDEAFAELDMHDPSGGRDGLMGNFGSDKPVKPTQALLVEAAKGAAEGLGDAVYEDMEREMPNVASVVTELSDTYQDFKDLKDEIAKQITPMVTSMENIGRKILPRVEKLMPKSWYEKAKKTLDERAEERRSGRTVSEQEARDQSVASELGSIFGEGGGEGGSQQALAQAEHNEREHKKERMFDLSMQATRNKTYVKYLASIYDSLRSTELFHRTLHTAYMKKDLELKYKHLFIAQDTYNLLSTSMSAFEGYFKGVVHNTSLPDAAKARAIEKRRTSKYGALIGDFLTNARKNVMNKLKSTVKDVLGNVAFSLSAAEAIPEEYEMADQMAEMGEGAGAKGLLVRKASRALAGLLSRGPSRALFQKFAPYLSFINGPDNDIKERGYLALNKLRNKMASSGKEWQQMIAEFLPTMNVDVAGSNDLLTHGEDGAEFDRLTRQSIVEIIPGYLRHIHTSIEQIRTGDANAEGLVYNIHRRRFTTAEEAREDAYNDSMMFGGNENQTEAVSKVLSTIHVGMEYNKKGSANVKDIQAQQKTISRLLANHSLTQANFLPEKIIAFASNPERRKNDTYIKNIGAGIKMADLVAACKMLKSAMIGNDGRLNKDIVARLESATISAMRGTDGFKTRLPTYLESFGMRDLLAGGYKDKNGNIVEGIVNDDNSLSKSFIAKRMSKYDEKDAAAYGYLAKALAEYMNQTRVVNAKTKRMANQFREGNYWEGIKGFGSEITDNGEDIVIDVEAIDGKLDEATKAKRKAREKRKAKKKGVLGVIVSAVRGSDKKPAEESKEKKQKQQKKTTSEKVAEEATGKEVEPGTSTTTGKEAAPDTSTAAKPEEKKGFFQRIRDWYTEWRDDLPQTPEEAEEVVNRLQRDAEKAWKERPKNWDETKKRITEFGDSYLKEHPEQAKKLNSILASIDKKVKVVTESKEYKAVTAVGTVIGKKVKSKAVALYDEYGKPLTDDATDYFKKNVLPHINKASKKGDRARRIFMLAMKNKKVRAQLKKDLGDEWDKLETSAKSKATKLAEEAPSWLGTKFKNTKEAVGGWFGKFKEAAGIKDTDKESKEGEGGSKGFLGEKSSRVSDKATINIYKLLKVWHKDFKTAANALAHDTGYITAQLNSQLKASGAEPVKDPGMSKYGIFGRGGYAIGKGVAAVASGAWKATSFMAGIYGKVLGTGAKLVTGVPGALGYIGKTIGGITGMNPYMDVYVKGREDEGVILSWRKQAFGKGVVFKDGTRVKATKDIDRPVYDPETGNELLSEADIEAGLWSPGLFSGTFKVASTLAKGVVKGIGAYYGSLGKAALLVAGGLFGTRGEKDEKYVDIYRKDEIGGGYEPILTRLKQERDPGVVFKNGERVERSSDIHEPVYDPVKKKKLIDENDIKHGLVNVHNRPIGTGSKGREGLVNMLVGGAGKLGSGIAKRLFGETGMKVLGAAGMGLVGIYKGFFNTIFGAGNAAVSGISKLGARLFGFDSPGGFGKKAFEGLNTRLDKLINLTTGILNKMGGEAGGGSGGGGGGTTKGTTDTSGEHINPATGEPIKTSPKINKPTVYSPGLSGEELDKKHKDTDWNEHNEGGDGSGGEGGSLIDSAIDAYVTYKALGGGGGKGKPGRGNGPKGKGPKGKGKPNKGKVPKGKGKVPAKKVKLKPKNIKKGIGNAGRTAGGIAAAYMLYSMFSRDPETGNLQVTANDAGESIADYNRWEVASRGIENASNKAVDAYNSSKFKNWMTSLKESKFGQALDKGKRSVKDFFGKGRDLFVRGKNRIANSKLVTGTKDLFNKALRSTKSGGKKLFKKMMSHATKAGKQGTSRLGKFFAKMPKYLTKSRKALTKTAEYAGKVGKVTGNVAAKAAPVLSLIEAGADANEARKKMMEDPSAILGRGAEDLTEDQKKSLAAAAAGNAAANTMGTMGVGKLVGAIAGMAGSENEALVEGDVTGALNQMLYGDRHAADKARKDIDAETGYRQVDFGTNLRSKFGDLTWKNALGVGAANLVDGVTNLFSGVTNDAARTAVGTGKLVSMVNDNADESQKLGDKVRDKINKLYKDIFNQTSYYRSPLFDKMPIEDQNKRFDKVFKWFCEDTDRMRLYDSGLKIDSGFFTSGYYDISTDKHTRDEFAKWLQKKFPSHKALVQGAMQKAAKKVTPAGDLKPPASPAAPSKTFNVAKKAASVAFSTALSAAPMAAAAQSDIVKEPTPVVQTVTQSELNETKLKTQAELVASKTNATKPPVDNKSTEKVSKGVDKLNDSMSDLADNMAPLKAAIDKDGMLHIAGMDQLLYITANKPVASGGTHVINNTIIREVNEGLDLRRKQW